MSTSTAFYNVAKTVNVNLDIGLKQE